MCHIQTFHLACNHKFPQLILCEEANSSPKRRHCLNPTFGSKPKPANNTTCAICPSHDAPEKDTVPDKGSAPEKDTAREKDTAPEKDICSDEDIAPEQDTILQEGGLTVEDAIREDNAVTEEDAVPEEYAVPEDDAVAEDDAVTEEDAVLEEDTDIVDASSKIPADPNPGNPDGSTQSLISWMPDSVAMWQHANRKWGRFSFP